MAKLEFRRNPRECTVDFYVKDCDGNTQVTRIDERTIAAADLKMLCQTGLDRARYGQRNDPLLNAAALRQQTAHLAGVTPNPEPEQTNLPKYANKMFEDLRKATEEHPPEASVSLRPVAKKEELDEALNQMVELVVAPPEKGRLPESPKMNPAVKLLPWTIAGAWSSAAVLYWAIRLFKSMPDVSAVLSFPVLPTLLGLTMAGVYSIMKDE